MSYYLRLHIKRTGEIGKAEYDESIRALIKRIIGFQEEIGLDVLVHGEYERNDMVEYFGERLDGFLFTENGWVLSYGTRLINGEEQNTVHVQIEGLPDIGSPEDDG